MRTNRSLRGLPIAGMAAAGVVLGHWLAYVFAVPSPNLRAQVLAASGHGYWVLAIKAAVVLGFVSVGTVITRALGGRAEGDPAGSDRFMSLAARLSVIQLLAFIAMEVTERLAAHAPVAQMLGHHLFALGLAVQFVLAFVGALVLLCLDRAAAQILALLQTQFLRPVSVRMGVEWTAVRPVEALAGAGGARGPPRR